MNIKAFARTIIPFAKPTTESASTQMKTDANNDREGNGQSSAGEDPKHRTLTPEEIQEAVAHLESLPGIKDNNLRVRLDMTDGYPVVYIEDFLGKVVRRIPEIELAQVKPGAKPKKSGNILNRAV